jgi:hypothetical protein
LSSVFVCIFEMCKVHKVKGRRGLEINIYVVNLFMFKYTPVAIMLLGSCVYHPDIVFFFWGTVTLNGATAMEI